MATKKKEDETTEMADSTAVDSAPESVDAEAAAGDGTGVLDTLASVAAGALETVAVVVGQGAAKVASVIGVDSDDAAPTERVHKRAEKIGVVASDKMTKTVTVRVDRLVKHPVYRKYIKKRKKFMAHDEMGAKIGDKVRIVETRPMSARKRWRVVEILHKAEL